MKLQDSLAGVVALLLSAASVHSAPRCDLNLIADCDEIYRTTSKESGVHGIYPSQIVVPVYCDMRTDGGRWTVVQRRMDGEVNFYRAWDQYKAGFGSASGEYWLGLENLYHLTNKRAYELRVDMEDFEGNKVFAQYTTFSVGSEADGYRLNVSGFIDGGAGCSLSHHNGMQFSTFDKDQDVYFINCAAIYLGAFWYNSCHSANLNGEYLWGVSPLYGTGIIWSSWKSMYYSLKSVSMKIRPVT
ncbi:microfibril-associated glycoprotein 4-like [Aplochiton taeniatus]